MRDPLAPIPSPFGRTTRSEQYWDQTQRIPLPRPTASWPGADPSSARAPSDPRLCLGSREDELGIDRRSRRRHDPAGIPSPSTTPVTAANHIPLQHFVGLESQHGWALMHGLALSPAGMMLRHFDLLDASMRPSLRHNARVALRGLSTALSTGDSPSPMSLVCGCVVSRRVVADLSYWANPDDEPHGPERESNIRGPMDVRLLVPTPPVTLEGGEEASGGSALAAAVSIPAQIVPLTDPSPDVIGVSLTDTSVARLRLILGMGTVLEG